MIVAAFISDRGGLYLPGCLESFNVQVGEPMPALVVDDHDHELGMAGAVRAAWEWAVEVGADFLFHVEEDFRFCSPAPVRLMARILETDAGLAQVVLKRQAWSVEERAAGGIIEVCPADYTDRSFGPGLEFVEHQRIFSLNPCLIPRRVLEFGWPDGNEAEFTEMCAAEGLRFAFYGQRCDPPRVEHVGLVRGAGWRL